MKKTTQYFKLSKEELEEIDDDLYTREELLLFREGLLVRFCSNKEDYEEFMANHKIGLPKLDFKMALKTVKGKIAVILH